MITVSKKWIRLIGIVGCTVWMASCKQASDAGVKSSSYAVMQIEAVDKEFSSSYSARHGPYIDAHILSHPPERFSGAQALHCLCLELRRIDASRLALPARFWAGRLEKRPQYVQNFLTAHQIQL